MAFFSRYTAFFYQKHFLNNPRLRIGCDFLPNLGNITPYVRWNKQKERPPREMHFYGIGSKIL